MTLRARSSSLALVATLATTSAAVAHAQGTARDLARARTLDQQGARAYAEGRYTDAIRYFEEAYRLGAPPIELWNIAKCHDRVDQPERAAEVLDRYLATPDLPKSDRAEAQQLLDAIKKRPSSLTVTSAPDGASVVVDGKSMPGRTPLTGTVAPGRHDVTVTRTGYDRYSSTFEAKFGRAVIVDVALRQEASGPPPASAAPSASTTPPAASAGPPASSSSRPSMDAASKDPAEEGALSLQGLLGLQIVRHGEVGGGAAPAFGAMGTYRIGNAGGARIALGGMLHVTFDSWKNSSNRQETAAPCGALNDANDGVPISVYGLADVSWRLRPTISAGPIAGLGLAGYVADQVGGDVFQPACSARTGVLPAVLVGGKVGWHVAPGFTLALFPILLHVQPAFDGARVTPRDASGVWVRATFAIGGGFDL